MQMPNVTTKWGIPKMKITKTQLTQIVQEELSNTMTEGFGLVGALSAVKDAKERGIAAAQDDFARIQAGGKVLQIDTTEETQEEEDAYNKGWQNEMDRLKQNVADRKLNRPPEPETDADIEASEAELDFEATYSEGTNKMKITKSKLAQIVQEELEATTAVATNEIYLPFFGGKMPIEELDWMEETAQRAIKSALFMAADQSGKVKAKADSEIDALKDATKRMEYYVHNRHKKDKLAMATKRWEDALESTRAVGSAIAQASKDARKLAQAAEMKKQAAADKRWKAGAKQRAHFAKRQAEIQLRDKRKFAKEWWYKNAGLGSQEDAHGKWERVINSREKDRWINGGGTELDWPMHAAKKSAAERKGRLYWEGKITKSKLAQIVQEELAAVTAEGYKAYKRDDMSSHAKELTKNRKKGYSPQAAVTAVPDHEEGERRLHKSGLGPHNDKKPKRGLDESGENLGMEQEFQGQPEENVALENLTAAVDSLVQNLGYSIEEVLEIVHGFGTDQVADMDLEESEDDSIEECGYPEEEAEEKRYFSLK